jgi:hypothetical protein
MDFLSTDNAPVRTTTAHRQAVDDEVAGNNTGGRPVVTWHPQTKEMVPGPASKYYESGRKRAGCHLVFNAFWAIQGFCIYQMCMRDPMHQMDKGVIVQLLKAILHLYHEQVESVMGQAGLAAKKMTARLSAALGSRTDSAGRK